MKFIRIVFMDINAFIKEKTLVFVLLFAGMFISCFSAVYYYSYRKSLEKSWGQGGSDTSFYSVEFSKPVNAEDLSMMLNTLEGVLNSSPYIPYWLDILDQNSFDSMDYKQKSTRVNNKDYKKMKYTYPRGIIGVNDKSIPDNDDILEGENFSGKDMGINATITDPGCKVGDTLVFYGHSFEVVGISKYNYNYTYPQFAFIRSDLYVDLNLPCKYIIIKFERIPPARLIEALNSEAKKIDSSASLFEPQIELPVSVIKSFRDEMLKVYTLIALTLIYIFALFRYWIIDNIRNFAVFTMCGAARKLIYSIILASAFIFVIVPYAIGCAIFYILNAAFDISDITYTLVISDHLSWILILYVFVIIAIIPSLLHLRRENIYSFVE